jgi:putative Mn2+ efflux pump MntP
MSEHEMQQLIRMILRKLFPKWLKWVFGIIAGVLISLIGWVIIEGFNTVVGQKQDAKDIQEFKAQINGKVDKSLFEQYMQATSSDMLDIKKDFNNFVVRWEDSQKIIQSDIKEILKRK